MQDLPYEVLEENSAIPFELSFKLIVIGDSGVGKSCITMKATKNIFEDLYNPTVGFEFFTFNIRIKETNLKLQIWDTCGQEVYRSLITSFYRNSSLAILVYSIDNDKSFASLENWINEIKSQANPDIKIFVVGNKADLNDERKVSKEEAEAFAKDHGITLFFETSAKTGLNIQNVFIEAAKCLYLENDKVKDQNFYTLKDSVYLEGQTINDEDFTDGDKKKKKKKCSC